jgi:hypothetical protein
MRQLPHPNGLSWRRPHACCIERRAASYVSAESEAPKKKGWGGNIKEKVGTQKMERLCLSSKRSWNISSVTFRKLLISLTDPHLL